MFILSGPRWNLVVVSVWQKRSFPFGSDNPLILFDSSEITLH